MGRGSMEAYMRRKISTPRWSGFLGALLFGVLCFPALSSAATVTYASNKVMGPTNGLVGYWTFNGADISGTTVLDRSGLGNNATMQNDPTKTTGKLGQGLQFSQSVSSQLVNAASPSSLDDLNQMTISVWVKRSPSGAQRTVVSKTDTLALSDGWRLSISGGGVLYFQSAFSAQWGQWSFLAPVKVNQWTHLVLTYDRTSPANVPVLYVNASSTLASDLATPSGTTLSDAAALLSIGGVNGFINSFPGSLDDVRIYNRILTPSEITQVYKAGQVQLASVTKKNASSLVGWWTFDGKDLSTATATDKSGYGNHATLRALAKPKATTGKIGQALKLGGGDQVAAALPSASLNDIAQLTLVAWVKPTSLLDYPYLFTKRTSTASGWDVAVISSRVRFENVFSGQDGVWEGPALKLNTWQHVVMTYNHSSASNVPTFYINGVATTTTTVFQTTGTFVSDAGNHFGIGGDATFGVEGFSGSMDDVRIYNRILSASEVKQLYKEGQVAVDSFTCGVSTVKDMDGNVYNTLKIGTQCWMKQNMRVGTRINVAGNQTNNAIIEKYCYSDNSANCTSNNPNHPDGGLYQWNEAMQYSTTPGAQGICPSDWHIPTHDEFTTLERAVCTSGSCATDFPYDTTTSGWRGSDEGTTLKPNGTSGFERNLSGYSNIGSFGDRDSFGYTWTSSEMFGSVQGRTFGIAQARVIRSTYSKTFGFSVRCLKN